MLLFHYIYNEYRGLVFRYSEPYTKDPSLLYSVFQNPCGNWIIDVTTYTYEESLDVALEIIKNLEDYK